MYFQLISNAFETDENVGKMGDLNGPERERAKEKECGRQNDKNY